MRKRWILVFSVLIALLAIFLVPLFLKPQEPFQPQSPAPLVLSVHQQTLNFKVEEALPVDLDGDKRVELVIREASRRRIQLVQWQGSQWLVKPLPISLKSSLLTNSIPRLDIGLIPEGVMKGKELLKFSDLNCLPVLLPDRKVAILRYDKKGNLRIQILVSNARFMLAGDLDGDGWQNDLIIGVLPKRLLWFVAKKDVLSLRQEINTSGSGKVSAWGQIENVRLSSHQLWISPASGTDERYLIWRNQLMPDTVALDQIRHEDFDGDGILDEAWVDLNRQTLQIWLSKSRRVFKLSPPSTIHSFCWGTGDLDHDGLVEVLMRDGNELVYWEMQSPGKSKSVTLAKKRVLGFLGFADVDGNGQTEAVILLRTEINPILCEIRGYLQRLTSTGPELPSLLLVRKTMKGLEWRKVKIFSTNLRKRGYKFKTQWFHSIGYYTDMTNTPSGICYFGGHWWLFVSANSGTTLSCSLCRLKNALVTLVGRHFICPHGHSEHWQETRFWLVKGDKAVEVLKVDAILAHEFKVRGVIKGVDLDGDEKDEAVLTRTIGKNAVFVARYRNERWEVGKVERPCRLVSLSLSRNPRPCLIAVWEDGTITQISVSSNR